MDSIASNKPQSMKITAMPELKHVSAFRRLLPQVRDAIIEKSLMDYSIIIIIIYYQFLNQFLASSAKNFLIWNLGLILAFPSIVIPSLTGFSTALNPHETLRITAAQASWLGNTR